MAKKNPADPAAQAQPQQAAQQHPDAAAQLRQAGVTDPGHEAAVHAAVARGVRLDVVLDLARRHGKDVLDLVQELVHAFEGGRGGAPPSKAQPAQARAPKSP